MDRKQIFEIESELRRICCVHPEYGLPTVNPDGNFGSVTEEAIRIMQSRAGLPVTGQADPRTLEMLAREDKKCMAERSPGRPIYAFPYPKYRAKRGEKSEFVALLRAVLCAISPKYDACGSIPPGEVNIYGAGMENAIREFQRINRLPETGEVDKPTWDRIAMEYNNVYQNYSITG